MVRHCYPRKTLAILACGRSENTEAMKKSFAFDCTNNNTSQFPRELLRDRRLTVAFSNGSAFRLDPSPATSLVEDLGEVLHLYIPGWENSKPVRTLEFRTIHGKILLVLIVTLAKMNNVKVA